MPGQHGAVLIIEDDPGTATLQRKCLERSGYRVFTAANRADAWMTVESHAIDLVLLDYKLQDAGTGLDFINDLKQLGRDLPCIVVTGFGNEQLAIDAFRAGVRDFLPKSVTYLADLPRAVERVFTQVRREDQLRRAEEDRRRLVYDLGERVKELALLQQVAGMLQDDSVQTDELLRRTAEALPHAFQNPQDTVVRIRFGERTWTGGNYRDSRHNRRLSIKTAGQAVGTIEVALLRDDFGEQLAPFLADEDSLLHSVAEMLSLHLDRQLALEQLRSSEQRYRLLIEASSLIVWTADPSGRIREVTQVLERFTGEEIEEGLGDGWITLLHPDDLQPTVQAWMRALQEKTAYQTTYRIRSKGSYLHVDVHAVPVLDSSGNVTEWVGTLNDITARRQHEATLARLANIVESSNDAIISKSLDGVVLSWNPGAERMYGYSAAEMIGRSVEPIVPPDQIDTIYEQIRAIVADERHPSFEGTRLRKDGALIEVAISLSPLYDADGKVVGTSSITRDVTERNAGERRRQLQQRVLQALADTASVGDAAKGLINALCEANGWVGGSLWLHDERESVLRFGGSWFESLKRGDEFYAVSERHTFALGQGLPGEAWQSERPVWVADFDLQQRFPRSALARELGLHGALGLPLKLGTRMVGVIEFFRINARPPTADDLELMLSLCAQAALFIDRKQTEAARARLAAILEATTDFVGMFNPAGEVLYLNGAGRRMLGLQDQADTAPLNTAECSPAWASDQLQFVGYPTALKEGAWSGESAVWNRAGYEIPVSQLILAHRGAAGELEYFSTIARDITERKKAEETLILHNRAMSASSEGIIITGPSADDAPIIYANDAFLTLTGYQRSQVLGRNCRFLQGPATDPAVLTHMRQAIESLEPCTVEILNYKADGSSFWSLVSITPVLDANGVATHFVGTQRDISERKRLEDQLRQTQKMEAIGSLAGGIAHDFNNMLTVILGYAEMARDTLAENSETHDLLDEITSAAQRAATLTGQLLAFSRRQMLTPQSLDVNAHIRDLQRLLRPLITADVDIVPELAEDLWRVKADPSQFDQIVMNLVINARDAMPNGGRLRIATRNALLTADLTRNEPDVQPGEYVLLTVGDTGCGMTPEVLGRIFEPFFTNKPKGKGTGMGLATVYGIVKQSSGHISVQSTPHTGTTFNIYLPRVPTAAVSVSEISPPLTASDRGTEVVLLVEDEPGVREFSRQVLVSQGYRVFEAGRGDEALELLQTLEHAIDALVTDVVMPGMGGRQLADELLRLQPDVKVLYLSGYTDDVITHHGGLDSEIAFLQKPFTRDALTRKLRKVLDG